MDGNTKNNPDIIEGIIRKPSKNKSNGFNLLNIDGIIPNLLLVIVQFIFIFGVPLIITAFTYLAMSSLTTF